MKTVEMREGILCSSRFTGREAHALSRFIALCLLVLLPLDGLLGEEQGATVTEVAPTPPHWMDSFQVHGFVTQGLVWTSDNKWFGNSPDVSNEFREMGLNFSVQPLPDLLLSAQALSRSAGDLDDGEIRLDYGMADYAFIQSLESRWGGRIGRIKNPIGLYNATRDADPARPSILLPQSIYLDRTRTAMMSSDSIFLYGEQDIGSDRLLLDAGYGYMQVNDPELERVMLLGKDWEGQLVSKPAQIVRALYETDNGWRFGGTYGVTDIGFDPRGSDITTYGWNNGNINIQYKMLSLQYEQPTWSLTFEFLRQTKETNDLGALSPDKTTDSDNYYLQGTYRPRHDLELMLRVEQSYADIKDKDGKEAAAVSPYLQSIGLPGFAAHNVYGTDITLGVRWDISPNWIARAEYHKVDGSVWLSRTENPDPDQTKENWDMVLFTLGYRF